MIIQQESSIAQISIQIRLNITKYTNIIIGNINVHHCELHKL